MENIFTAFYFVVTKMLLIFISKLKIMGFKSTLISDHWASGWRGELPDWFKEKYQSYIAFPGGTVIASTCEIKLYGGQELFVDFQKALTETGFFPANYPVTVAVLAEDGTITKVTIEQNKITYMLMHDWYTTDGVWAQ